jgi:thiol-disulfide isomerase/thioredoxin
VLLVAAACNPSPKVTADAPATSANASADASASASASVDAAKAGVRLVFAAQDSDALSVVRTERLRAKAEGRVLVVYAGASWCEPCKRFKHAIEAGTLDEKLSKTTLLVFDADRDTERLASAGYAFKFIPYVALAGADGHPSDSGEARGKGSEAWREVVGKMEGWQSKGP